MLKKTLLILGVITLLSSCMESKKNIDLKSKVIDLAVKQISNQTDLIEESGKFINPRTYKNNQIVYVDIEDWTSGFFPGTIWYMYELTGDEKWKTLAVKYTESLESAKNLKWHHDVGFIINCSFGNAHRITKNDEYKHVIVDAAKSLSTRYRPIPGVIQSWDEDLGWQKEKGWMCPVIIDNMMNLELLFEATRLSGDSSFYKMAINHADNTLKNHFRDDYSCYHVVDYDKTTGEVRSKVTAQGYSDNSSWARGQAWAIYGFTLCYRETRDIRYLELADKIYQFLFNNKNMPDDLVPYWDFDAPNIPNEPRDASTASIIASALYEMSSYNDGVNKEKYKKTADLIMTSLSTDYLAFEGGNGNFLLKHSVGSIPHNEEINVPLNYADYYFLEALLRKIRIEKNIK